MSRDSIINSSLKCNFRKSLNLYERDKSLVSVTSFYQKTGQLAVVMSVALDLRCCQERNELNKRSELYGITVCTS